MTQDDYLQILAGQVFPEWARHSRDLTRIWMAGGRGQPQPAPERYARVFLRRDLTFLLPQPQPRWSEMSATLRRRNPRFRVIDIEVTTFHSQPDVQAMRSELVRLLRDVLDRAGWPPIEEWTLDDFEPSQRGWLQAGIQLSREMIEATRRGLVSITEIVEALQDHLLRDIPAPESSDPFAVTIRSMEELAGAFTRTGTTAAQAGAAMDRLGITASEAAAAITERLLNQREEIRDAGNLRAAEEFEPGLEFAFTGSIDAGDLAEAARTSAAIGDDDPAQDYKPASASTLPWDEWVKQSAKVLDANRSVFPYERASSGTIRFAEADREPHPDCRCVDVPGEPILPPPPGSCLSAVVYATEEEARAYQESNADMELAGATVTSDDDEAT